MKAARASTNPAAAPLLTPGTRPAAGPSARPRFIRTVTRSHDEYLSSFRHLRLDGFLLDRAIRPFSLERCRLSSCIVEHGTNAAPWAARGATADGVLTFAFAGATGTALRVDGCELPPGAVCLWPEGTPVSIVARQPSDWFVVTVSGFALAGIAMPTGPEAERNGAGGPRRIGPDGADRVRALASRILGAAEASRTPAPPKEDVAALERSLLAELARLAAEPRRSSRHDASPRIDRRLVLERIEELLAARSTGPLYVADLCEATGLPERTLRFILVEQFGTSPVRLLRNRRLCQLRRSLLSECEPGETLARIASRHGFWHMGTLAADYRSLFGELPSETRRSCGGFVPSSVPGTLEVASPPEGSDRAPESRVSAPGGSPGR